MVHIRKQRYRIKHCLRCHPWHQPLCCPRNYSLQESSKRTFRKDYATTYILQKHARYKSQTIHCILHVLLFQLKSKKQKNPCIIFKLRAYSNNGFQPKMLVFSTDVIFIFFIMLALSLLCYLFSCSLGCKVRLLVWDF